jgi:hypothetical protein
MHAFDVLGDPVRRRILELLATGEHSSGDIVAVVQREFGITQSAVSQQLRVLRDSGFASVRAASTRCNRAGFAKSTTGSAGSGHSGCRGLTRSRLKLPAANENGASKNEGAVSNSLI